MGIISIEKKVHNSTPFRQTTRGKNVYHGGPFQSIICDFETYTVNALSIFQDSAVDTYHSSLEALCFDSPWCFDRILGEMVFDNVIKIIDRLFQKIASILRRILSLQCEQCQLIKIKFWSSVYCFYGSPVPIYVCAALSPPHSSVLLDKTAMF